MQLLHYILNGCHYLVLLDTICVNLPAKLLFKIHTAWTFIKIISIPNKEEFSETAVGCTASYFDVPVGVVTPSSVPEGLLLLHIG